MNVLPLAPDVRVEVTGELPDLPAQVAARVESLWQEAMASPSRLFNGPIFSVDSFSRNRIRGRMSEYRRFIAQQRDPELRQDLRVRPLGVTGVHLCRDGFVLCRRADHVATMAGHWELSPAGSVDDKFLAVDGTIDIRAQLLAELVEETGISRKMLTAPVLPFGLVDDDRTGVVDVAMLLRSELTEAAVREIFQARRTREYVAIEIVSRERLETVLTQLDQVSRALIGAAIEMV